MARLGQFSGSQVTTTIPTSAVSPIARQPTPKPSSTGEKLKSGLKSYLNWLNPVTAVPKLLSSKPVQKVVDVFNIPLYATAGALKAVEKPELEQGLRPSISREWSTPSNISLAISGAKQGLKEKTMLGDVLRQREEMGQEQSKLKKAGAFVSDIAFPSLPVAKLVSGTAKVSKAVGVTDKASDILRPVFNLTKKVSDIPAVQKVAEAVSPGYKVPEVRNIIKEAEEVANTRVNQLARTIKEAAKGLSKAQQERVGQLMEGGVTATGDSKLALIAKQMNNLADEIGAEGVALWEKTNGKFGLNPESYLKFKGKYLTHIWSEMTEGGKKTVSYINKPGGISGQFYKLRKGAEGYTRQFAPATFKGLGTQVRDIELSKAYLKVAEKYGIPMEKLQKPESVVAEAINVLLKEHKTPKVGLGTPNFSGTMEIPPKGVGQSTLGDIDKYSQITEKLKSGRTNVAERTWYKNQTQERVYQADQLLKELQKPFDPNKMSQEEAKQLVDKVTQYNNLLDNTPKIQGRFRPTLPETIKQLVGDNVPSLSLKEIAAQSRSLDEFANGTHEIPLADIKIKKSILDEVSTEEPSRTPNKPLVIGISKDGSLTLADGYHRYAEIIRRGDKTAKVVIETPSDYNVKDLFNQSKGITQAPKTNIQPPKGVGEVYPSQNIANYLLDVFKKYQPAHRLSQAEEQAQGIYTGLAKAELTGKTAQPIEEWVRRNGAAFQQVFHFTPDESSLRAFISQVGELPAVKGSKLKLDVGKAERLVTEGFGYAPEMVRKMGVSKLFEDVGLPQEVIDYINFVSKTPNHNLFDDALNAWKVGKTILNPAYHFRNIFSNQVLAGWATGKNIFSTTVDSVKAFYKLHQGDDIIFKAAEDSNTINAKSFVKNLQEFMDEADLVANKGRLQRYVNWWKKFQQTSEDTAKLNVFTFKIEEVARKSGRQVAEVLTDPKVIKMAKDAAEEAIFSPYRISIGERELLKRIIPFYAFTRQALPFYAKTLYKTPGRVLPYHRLKPAIESQLTNLVPEEKRAEWQKQQIQLPKAVSKLLGVKEPVALDTTYLMPQGNFGEDFGTSLGKGQLPFGLSINPFAMEIMQQIFGKDLYFDQPFGQGALPGADVKDILSTNPVRRTSERIDHALNTLAPALYRTIKGKVYPAFAEKPDYAGRERSKTMAILDALGIKMSVLRPEDQVKFQSYDQYQLIEQIKSEMRSIAKDQSRSPAQKQKLLEEYMKELQKVATGK